MTDNTAPERVTLIVTRDGRVSSVLGHGTIGNPRMDADAVEYVRADILRDLREAVEACAEALGAWEMSSKPFDPTITQGLLRAGDKARRALASLDEQGGSDE